VFVWQGLAITAIGVVLGLGLGVTLGHYLTALVGWVQSQFGLVLVDPRVYSIDELPVVLSLMDTIWIVGLALVLGLGATLLPALTAARLKPAESLKHD
jgi:lipoprotein-releasing system permease protein